MRLYCGLISESWGVLYVKDLGDSEKDLGGEMEVTDLE